MNIITVDQLEAKLWVWQTRLNLTDWDIRIAIVPMADMQERDTEGLVEFCVDKKQADIKLLDPQEHPKNSLREYDMEKVLVHELLHISMALFSPRSGIKVTALEQSINAIASSLVSLSQSIGKNA